MWKPETDAQVLDAVNSAKAQKITLSVIGHATKANYGRPATGARTLDMSGLSGIVDYRPEELMVTVKAGTPLAALNLELMSRRQHLTFEPADWGPVLGKEAGGATVGGIVAAAVSGPRRLKAGATRDHVLAIDSVSGLGIAFASGAKVVKNVTGFDLPKLLTGSMGTLAVMTELTLRVGPVPETEITLAFEGLDSQGASALMRDGAASPMEVSGAAHFPFPTATTYLRLEGPAVSVAERADALIRELASEAPVSTLEGQQSQELWRSIRDVGRFAESGKPLWRLAVPPSRATMVVSTIAQNLPCRTFYDRAGSLVWLECEGDDPGESWVRAAAALGLGQATLFRATPEQRAAIAPFHPESPAIGKLSETVKMAFDPMGILEPSRMVRGR